jgi:hypothetical protein
MYLEIAPNENLSIEELIACVNDFETNHQKVLFEHRSDSFHFFSTQTEKLFQQMKSELSLQS